MKRLGTVTVYAEFYSVAKAVSPWSQYDLGTLPEGFRPAAKIGGCAYCESGSSTGNAPISIDTNGTVKVLTRGLTLEENWHVSFCCAFAAS